MTITRNVPKVFAISLAIAAAGGDGVVPCGAEPSAQQVAVGWSTFRGDAERRGSTAHDLPVDLSLRWVYEASPPPAPAWPRSDRMPFDRALQPIVSGGKVVFGSSADGAVHALDLDTGATAWVFRTDAPVRFAPAAWQERVFVASDDGFLYALATADGQLVWKRRGGPDRQLVLGNQQLISKWPARGGPVVVGETVYFAAGIWPTDGIYLYALDTASGAVQWVNDNAGSLRIPQPHPPAEADSGVSAQGYLVVSGNHLLVPTGRAVPASFDRHTGRFEYFHLQVYGHQGGTATMAVDETFFNSGYNFDVGTGKRLAAVGAGQLAAIDRTIVRCTEGTLQAYDWVETQKPDRRGQPVKGQKIRPLWTVDGMPDASALIIAGRHVLVGGTGQVAMVDRQRKQLVWSARVIGRVYGLAAAEGSLLVSTDAGSIYCFDASGGQHQVRSAEARASAPYGDTTRWAEAADEILQRSAIAEGYCVDLGCGDGALAFELAQRSRLRICAIEDDVQKVKRARAKLAAAGVYGSRVTVHLRPLADTGLPKYMANLIVSARSLTEGGVGVPQAEAGRLQRPCGGVICVGKPGAMQLTTRGPLTGAGNWTHQYANAANTLVSDDTLVKGRLSILWFRDVDFDLPQRHGRAPAPLYAQGRLFHEGIDGIIAVDAYNGRELWRYEIPGLLKAYDGDELMGVAGTGGNCCVHENSVYVRDEGRCLRLDAATGKLLDQFKPPPGPDRQPGPWGYIACVDGILYGTHANPKHVVTYRFVNRGGDMSRLLTESDGLFALNARTGDTLWQYQAKDSIRHNAIAIGAGKVCLIDRPLALFDRVKRPKEKTHPTGRLLVLDSRTGRTLWTADQQVDGTLLALSAEQNVLLMSYQPTRFRLDSEFGGRMSAYRLDTGERLWQVAADYHSRPMLADTTIYAQGGAWELRSGQSKPFELDRSYGCGILAGCRNMLLFRSATLGYRNLESGSETENYGGMRPGCWVNTLPAGGIVLVPDASTGCRCSYLNRAWVALEPR